MDKAGTFEATRAALKLFYGMIALQVTQNYFYL